MIIGSHAKVCKHAAGAKTAICELPFDRISSDTKGGAGGKLLICMPAGWLCSPATWLTCPHPFAGTCVLRGCVPKKLMVIGGEFGHAFQDSKAFG